MRLAVNIPNFGPFEDPHTVVDLARRAEAAGWDGLFVWDHLVFEDGNEVADPWVLLTAAAMATERLLLAPMVTPLPRRRPWVVARQAVSLDRLSNGRLILGVGIGEPADLDFEIWGEDADRKVRAAQLDEGLEVLTGLWSGEPFRFSGEHYEVGPVTFLPRPVQQPRIPIWVAGVWPYKRPFRRAARFDGVAPLVVEDGVFPAPLTPDKVRLILEYVRAHQASENLSSCWRAVRCPMIPPVPPTDWSSWRKPAPPGGSAAGIRGAAKISMSFCWWLTPVRPGDERRSVHEGGCSRYCGSVSRRRAPVALHGRDHRDDRVRRRQVGPARSRPTGQSPPHHRSTPGLSDADRLRRSIDSAAIQPQHWLDIADAIVEHAPGHAGVVVLHGTDTMAYTAGALSFLLEGLDIPIVLTGAQRRSPPSAPMGGRTW